MAEFAMFEKLKLAEGQEIKKAERYQMRKPSVNFAHEKKRSVVRASMFVRKRTNGF